MAEERLEAWAAEHAADVLARARAGALEDAERVLRERLARALLAAIERPAPAPAPAPAPVPARPRRSPAGDGGTLLWVYGVVPAGDAAPARPGVDGAAVRLVDEGRLAALVSAVPHARYGEVELAARLEDLDELERLARAHDGVLEAALEDGDVLPLRLCTLYESETSLRTMLAREADALAATLTRIAGRAEWGVKAYLRPPDRAADEARGPASGTEYLTRRSEEREVAVAAREAVEGSVAAVHARLAERASAAVLARPQDRRLTGRDEEMVLNGAYLVPRDAAGSFVAVVDELRADHAAEGLELELTGPWPPYHFAGEAPR